MSLHQRGFPVNHSYLKMKMVVRKGLLSMEIESDLWGMKLL